MFEKITRTPYLINCKDLSSHNWRQDSQSLKIPSEHPNTGIKISYFEKKNNLKFSEYFLKKSQNVISRKLQGFEQSYLKARFAILESTLNASNYKVGNFKFC